MTLFGFRAHSPSNVNGIDKSIPPQPAPKVLSKNFHVCPHCQKCGRPALLECLDEESPIISRSDGETFHLVLGDKPIWFPPENARGVGMATAGFWYVHEANSALTETVVVMLRRAPRRGVSLTHHLEMVADRLAEKLSHPTRVASVYEFYGRRLHRVS